MQQQTAAGGICGDFQMSGDRGPAEEVRAEILKFLGAGGRQRGTEVDTSKVSGMGRPRGVRHEVSFVRGQETARRGKNLDLELLGARARQER